MHKNLSSHPLSLECLQFIERQLKANLYGTCLAFYVDVQIMFGNIKFVYPEYSEKIRDNELLQKVIEISVFFLGKLKLLMEISVFLSTGICGAMGEK